MPGWKNFCADRCPRRPVRRVPIASCFRKRASARARRKFSSAPTASAAPICPTFQTFWSAASFAIRLRRWPPAASAWKSAWPPASPSRRWASARLRATCSGTTTASPALATAKRCAARITSRTAADAASGATVRVLAPRGTASTTAAPPASISGAIPFTVCSRPSNTRCRNGACWNSIPAARPWNTFSR